MVLLWISFALLFTTLRLGKGHLLTCILYKGSVTLKKGNYFLQLKWIRPFFKMLRHNRYNGSTIIRVNGSVHLSELIRKAAQALIKEVAQFSCFHTCPADSNQQSMHLSSFLWFRYTWMRENSGVETVAYKQILTAQPLAFLPGICGFRCYFGIIAPTMS